MAAHPLVVPMPWGGTEVEGRYTTSLPEESRAEAATRLRQEASSHSPACPGISQAPHTKGQHGRHGVTRLRGHQCHTSGFTCGTVLTQSVHYTGFRRRTSIPLSMPQVPQHPNSHPFDKILLFFKAWQDT